MIRTLKSISRAFLRTPLALLCGALLGASAATSVADPAAGVPLVTNAPGADYPRLLPDNRIVFHAKAPHAQSVKFLLGKEYVATRDNDGTWTATTEPQVPGFHYYWLVIDDARVADPNSATFYGTGRDTSGVEIPEAGNAGDFYAWQDVPHGDVRERWYHSKVTGDWRRCFVYTPPGYDTDQSARYPVLYLQHGGGEDERGWVIQGKVNPILDNLIAAGKAKPMIIVMDRGYARRPGDPDLPSGPPAGPRQDTKSQAVPLPPEFQPMFFAFEDVMTKDLIPLIDATYRTIPDREHRAIAGFSMGGMQAFLVGLRHLDAFSAIGGLSGGGGGFGNGEIDSHIYLNGVFADAKAFNEKMRLIFIGLGSEEPPPILNGVRGYRDTLEKLGIRYVYFESPGTSHEWLTERRSLREFTTQLFR